jgi:parvulin-like peptidyl-prolyl isomerase
MSACFFKKCKGVVMCLFLAVGMSGCDLVDTIKEYFQGPGTEPAPKAASVEKPAVVDRPQQPGPSVEGPLPPNVLARVGAWTITVDEFKNRLNALKEVVPDFDAQNIDAKKMVLEELVRQQLVVLDAERRGVGDQKDIKAAMEEFRRTLLVQEVVRKLTEGIGVSDEEVQKFYEEQKALLVEPEQWRVRVIVVDSQLKANEISVELLKGVDFSETARQNSIGPEASAGGDLGFITEAPFPEMAGVLMPLNPGDISSVFKGPQGYYIVKVEEKKSGEQIPFEKIKEEIKQNQMMLKQQQAVLDYVKKLEQEIKTETKEELLGQ